VKQIRNSAHKI